MPDDPCADWQRNAVELASDLCGELGKMQVKTRKWLDRAQLSQVHANVRTDELERLFDQLVYLEQRLATIVENPE